MLGNDLDLVMLTVKDKSYKGDLVFDSRSKRLCRINKGENDATLPKYQSHLEIMKGDGSRTVSWTRYFGIRLTKTNLVSS